MEPEVAKLQPGRFLIWLFQNDARFDQIKGHYEVAKAVIFLKAHSVKNGSHKVNWSKVFTHLYARNFVGASVKRLEGLQSLVWWILRNTGRATPVTIAVKDRLVAFILMNRYELLCMLRYKREKTLVKMMQKIAKICGSEVINWPAVVSYLIRKRNLFKVYVPEMPDHHCDFMFVKNQ